MPNGDGTGPLGNGCRGGRQRQGQGQGSIGKGMGQGRGKGLRKGLCQQSNKAAQADQPVEQSYQEGTTE